MHRLEKYTDECFSHLKKHLKQYAAVEDMETLHKIRVEIKKIKAVTELINTNVKGSHAHRIFVPLRGIFRAAGKIREAEVSHELLLRQKIETIHVPNEEKQGLLSRRFRKEVPDFIRRISDRKAKLDKHVSKITKSKIKEYLRKKNEELRLELRGRGNEKSLHNARKLTKEILYIGSVLKIDGTFFDELQQLIGQWHDRQVLLAVLAKQKSPEFQKLKEENKEKAKRIRKFVSAHYKGEKNNQLSYEG